MNVIQNADTDQALRIVEQVPNIMQFLIGFLQKIESYEAT